MEAIPSCSIKRTRHLLSLRVFYKLKDIYAACSLQPSRNSTPPSKTKLTGLEP